VTRSLEFALALLVVNAMAAPRPRPEVPVAELERRYLVCDQIASTQSLSPIDGAECSEVSERLLQQRFDGDFDRLLHWWRVARQAQQPLRTPFEIAQMHHEAGRYVEAYALFAHLADCGHREAARLALQMRQLGAQIYGMDFEASPQRMVRWQGLLAADTDAGPGSCTAA
jgi:hypothetical protein